MANDLDELSIKITESSGSSMQSTNGNGINTTNGNINVIIPSSISVANAVSKLDAAAQNAQNHYTVVKKQRTNVSLSTNSNNHDVGNSNGLSAIASIAPNNLNNLSATTTAKSISSNLLLTTATSTTTPANNSDDIGNDSKVNSRNNSHHLVDNIGRDNNSNIGNNNGATSNGAVNIIPSSSNGK